MASMVVSVEHVDNEYGLWCNDCHLPSGVRVFFTVTCACHTVLRSQNVCADCEGRNVT